MSDQPAFNANGPSMSPEPPDTGAPPAPPKKPVWIWVLLGCGIAAGVFLLVGVLFAALLFPAVGKVRENARRANCKSNLRQIGLACHIYADDNDEEFPPSLQTLYPMYVDNAKLFSCPSSASSYRDFAGGRVTTESSSYVLLPNRFPALPGDFILAYEKPDDHQGQGINVLFVDAHVAWWSASDGAGFQKTLAEQEKKFAELRKERDKQKASATKGP